MLGSNSSCWFKIGGTHEEFLHTRILGINFYIIFFPGAISQLHLNVNLLIFFKALEYLVINEGRGG